MDKKRVLIITQEMQPYTEESIIAQLARKLPTFAQENGMEIRVLMPRFGTINERRHRLHEVVRLSGMNIIVDDDDFPLIIKVASLPGARMQVYFLDNDDFFKRKQIFNDADGNPFEDNPKRMVFFCKGAIETVKKFGWAPDIVHCHGWMTSLIPVYLKTAYKNEPLFRNSKVVYSLYDNPFEETFNESFFNKANINNLEAKDLDAYKNGTGVKLHYGASSYADGVIFGSKDLNGDVANIKDLEKPFLDYQEEQEENLTSYLDFYHSLLPKEE